MAKKIGIISIKGGVGKTTIVSSLGEILANDFDKKVLLVDANFTAPNLGLHLGLINPKYTIQDIFNLKAGIKESIYTTEHGFDIIPGSLLKKEVDPFKLKDLLNKLNNKYDVILIDSSPNLNNEILSTMKASDELYVVTTPDHVTLAMTINAVKIAKNKGAKIKGLILNKVYDKKFELTTNEIEQVSESLIVGIISHNLDILKSLSKYEPFSLSGKNSIKKEVKKMAGAMIGEKYRENGIFGKIGNILTGLKKQDINREILLGEK